MTIFPESVVLNRAADILRERGNVQAPTLGGGGDLPTDFGTAGRMREWFAARALQPNSAWAACTDGTLRPLGPFIGIRAMWQQFPEGWLRAYVYRLPCEAKLVIPTSAISVTRAWREFPIKRLTRPAGDFDLDVDGPFVKGVRSRRFGAVTYVEHLKDTSAQLPIYRKYCTIEATVKGASLSTRVESSYGCTLEYAADLNGDGLSDFIIHMGGESCEFSVLYASSPSGWSALGAEGSCE